MTYSHRYTDFLLSNFRSDGLMTKLLGSLLMARVANDDDAFEWGLI